MRLLNNPQTIPPNDPGDPLTARSLSNTTDAAADAQDRLSSQDQQALDDANRRAATILKATRMATFNAVTTGIFAAFGLLFALADTATGLTGLALAVVSWNELRGRNLLRRFDTRAPGVLALNQLGLMVVMILYSSWHIYQGVTGPNPYEHYINSYPELASTLGPLAEINQTITIGVYGGVIAVSIVFQTAVARYYMRRQQLLTDYLMQTPPWIVELHRSVKS